MKRALTIIIPVYNAFEDLFACVESLLYHGIAENVSVLIIDDASTEGCVESALFEKNLTHRALCHIKNERNLGFVGTINKGFEVTKKSDVILLNSDTVVTKNWWKKLQQAAYSDPEIGTVSPFTNNGVVTSIPDFFEVNSLPPGYGPEEMNSLVERLSKRVYPELPSCVGCCLYIKRSVLDAVGYFDADTFSRGYGEENDFSLRMQKKGWRDILDDATFIYHKGDASFGEEKIELVKRNTEILQKRYPHYFERVRKFRKTNPLAEVHRPIQEQLFTDWEEGKKARILHLIHNGPYKQYRFELGGTERTVQVLIEQLPDYAHYSLVYWEDTYCITAHLPGWDKAFFLCSKERSISSILDPNFFSLIHLHHMSPAEIPDLPLALKRHGNYTVSLHDYTLACPRNFLLTPKQKLCNGHECVSSCGYTKDFISTYRKNGAEIVSQAKAVIGFSNHSASKIDDLLSLACQAEVLSHGLTTEQDNFLSEEEPPETLRILLLGALASHKGLHIYKDLFREQEVVSGVPCEWHILGDDKTFPYKHVITHGRYSKETLPEHVANIKPHLALFCSLAAETYSLAVDEALSQSVPVIVSGQGAPAERVKAWRAGWVLDTVSKDDVVRVLQMIVSDWESYLEVKERVCQLTLPTIADEIERYEQLYEMHANHVARVESLPTLLAFLFENSATQIEEKRFVRRQVGKCLGFLIVTLERLGFRSEIQYFYTRYLPKSLQYRIKKLRIHAMS